MAKKLYEEQNIRNIADAIKVSSDDTTKKYKVSEMATAIETVVQTQYSNGISIGYADGKNEGYEEGYEQGHTNGYNSGKQDGYNEGLNFYLPLIENKESGTYYPLINFVDDKIVDLNSALFSGCNRLYSVKLNNCITVRAQGAFCYSPKLKTVELPRLTALVNAYMFQGTPVDTLYMPNLTTLHSNAFSYATSLKTLVLKPYGIRTSFSISSSGSLSDSSIQNVITALAYLSGQTAQKVTFHSTVKGRLTDSQLSQISAKNWTLG